MKIKNLRKMLPDSRTWQWETVESGLGTYFTFNNGKGILYQNHENNFGYKVATMEKFQVCKTASGTRKKLNRIFSQFDSDPTPDNSWKL